jgi:hypothetical protein
MASNFNLGVDDKDNELLINVASEELMYVELLEL